MLSSFSVLPYEGLFSFSPVSFHASFVTATKVVVLDIQNSKFILDAKVAPKGDPLSGQFSPNGHFFACQGSGHEICVWQNTPTAYVLWSILKPRLPAEGFSWSPSSFSILCLGGEGIHLLHPSPLSPDGDKPNNLYKNHLVAYSPDQAQIAITQKGDSVVTILDSSSGTTQQLINTSMQIREIKVTGNTLVVVDAQKLVNWDLETGEIVPSIHETFATHRFGKPLLLSHDCSHLIFLWGRMISLYDRNDHQYLKSYYHNGTYSGEIVDMRFSPDGLQLWFIYHNFLQKNLLIKLDIMEDWHWSPFKTASEGLGERWSWVNHFSPSGYQVGRVSEWVVDPKGRKILWFPLHWRVDNWEKVRWDGNFLAFVGNNHPEPIIIKFQP